jgi:hypothetical protein
MFVVVEDDDLMVGHAKQKETPIFFAHTSVKVEETVKTVGKSPRQSGTCSPVCHYSKDTKKNDANDTSRGTNKFLNLPLVQ